LNKLFLENSFLKSLLIMYVVASILLGISPLDRFGWVLENLLLVFFFGIIIWTYRFYQFSNLSYLLIATFMMLHTIGAHYSYETPFNQFLNAFFGNGRDNFDRVVHFTFGLLIAYPGFEFIRRVVGIMKIWSYFFTVIVILAMGAFYELIEMWVSNIVAPGQGALFIGLQGDSWDTQHDISSAMYGAIITMVITAIVTLTLNKKARFDYHANSNQTTNH
jgi:putative membrane protein